jgi:hypothetical protein
MRLNRRSVCVAGTGPLANAGTAALDITVPQSILLRADEVIQ